MKPIGNLLYLAVRAFTVLTTFCDCLGDTYLIFYSWTPFKSSLLYVFSRIQLSS